MGFEAKLDKKQTEIKIQTGKNQAEVKVKKSQKVCKSQVKVAANKAIKVWPVQKFCSKKMNNLNMI